MILRPRAALIALTLFVMAIPFVSLSAQDGTSASDPLPLDRFDYTPPDMTTIREIEVEQRGDVTIRSIVYSSLVPGSDVFSPVAAYLVTPAGEGSFAGILYSHWLGNVRSSRDEFLDEAVEQAENGVVSMLVNNAFVYSNWYRGDPARDSNVIVRQIIDFRQALDILLAQPGVDPERIAFVGHDYGAMYGVVLAAVEPRIHGFVLMTPTSRFLNWPPFQAKANDAEYTATFAPFEPINALPHAQAPILLQFGGSDSWVEEHRRAEFANVIREGDQLIVYDGIGHDLASEQATEDRYDWIASVFEGEPLDLSDGA